MKRALICLAVLALLIVPALASANVISTGAGTGPPFNFTATGSNGGAMFDLTNNSAVPITLTGQFDGIFGTPGLGATNIGASGTVQVYYRTGSYVGFTGSLAGWTELGTAPVTGPDDQTPITYDVGNTLVVNPGSTIGLFVYLDSPALGGVVYANPSPSAATIYTDPFGVSLSLGSSIGDTGSIPFSTSANVFTYRVWDGSVFYTAVPVPPSALLLGTGLLGLVALRRRQSKAVS